MRILTQTMKEEFRNIMGMIGYKPIYIERVDDRVNAQVDKTVNEHVGFDILEMMTTHSEFAKVNGLILQTVQVNAFQSKIAKTGSMIHYSFFIVFEFEEAVL